MLSALVCGTLSLTMSPFHTAQAPQFSSLGGMEHTVSQPAAAGVIRTALLLQSRNSYDAAAILRRLLRPRDEILDIDPRNEHVP